MRRLFALIVLLSALVWLSPTANASSYHVVDGYRVYSGHSGYWHGNHVYQRQYYTVPGYYAYGYYYPARQSYRYTFWYTYSVPATSNYADSSYGGDHKRQLLAIVAARDKAEAKIRQGVLNQAYFLQDIKALGLEGNFRWQNYGSFPNLGTYSLGHGYQAQQGYNGSLNLSPAGVNGTSVYGYTYSQVANLYGDLNMNQLYQQAARVTETAMKMAGQTSQDFSGLVGQAGENQAAVAKVFARVAEIEAKARATEAFLKSLGVQEATIKTTVQNVKVVPNDSTAPPQPQPMPPPPPQPGPGVDGPAEIKAAPNMDVKAVQLAILRQDCGSCHSGPKAEGKWEYTSWTTMSQQERTTRVLSRLLTDDLKRRMPRTADGSPAPPYPLAKVRALMLTE